MQRSSVPSMSSIAGCLAGSALGDAIGEIAFRVTQENNLRAYIEDADTLRYTDDTAMALGLAESIIACNGTVRAQHLGETFRKNYEQEPWRGYGPGPPSIFRTVKQSDTDYLSVAQNLYRGQGSMGNGAAMRIAPLGVFFAGSDDLPEMASLSARVTHAHPLGQDGAVVLASAISLATQSDRDDGFSTQQFVRALSESASTDEFRDALQRVQRLLQGGADREQAAAELGTDVLIHRSVPYAIYCFLNNPHSFEAALLDAILVPGDRDTIGAMTGGVAGAYLGQEAIPKGWLERLENRSRVEELASKLHEIRQQRET